MDRQQQWPACHHQVYALRNRSVKLLAGIPRPPSLLVRYRLDSPPTPALKAEIHGRLKA